MVDCELITCADISLWFHTSARHGHVHDQSLALTKHVHRSRPTDPADYELEAVSPVFQPSLLYHAATWNTAYIIIDVIHYLQAIAPEQRLKADYS